MSDYKPPFQLTSKIIYQLAEICELLGRITALRLTNISTSLKQAFLVRSIHASLAIEQNSLSLAQVKAVLDGKMILANPIEIKEVQNAADAYKLISILNPAYVDDLLRAHKLMLKDLVPENGKFRSGGVGVFKGDMLIHMAPPAQFVPKHIHNLFTWYQRSEHHPLIKSAIFHYEFEYIHPFADGNGRIGRMWHRLLLGTWKELFFYLPLEEFIKSQQKNYYDALNIADKTTDCADFVELMLEIIRDSLTELTLVDRRTDQVTDQVIDQVTDQDNSALTRLLLALGNETLKATDLMQRLGLSHKPTFRKNYLNPALEQGLIERTIPDKKNSSAQKYRKAKK